MVEILTIALIIMVIITGVSIAALNKKINKLYIKVEKQQDKNIELFVSLLMDLERVADVCLNRQLDKIKHDRKRYIKQSNEPVSKEKMGKDNKKTKKTPLSKSK